METRLMMRVRPNGQPEGRTVEFQDGEAPEHGDKRVVDGQEWTCVDPDYRKGTTPTVRLEPATIAHSRPRKGDKRDPGAPRYDAKGRPVLLTSEEKRTYAKMYEQHNNEPCRFERTSSQGAFGDEE